MGICGFAIAENFTQRVMAGGVGSQFAAGALAPNGAIADARGQVTRSAGAHWIFVDTMSRSEFRQHVRRDRWLCD